MSLTATPFFASAFDPFVPSSALIRRHLNDELRFREMDHIPTLFGDAVRTYPSDERELNVRLPSYSYKESNTMANIEVELPGVAMEHVDIKLNGNILNITAKRFKHTLTKGEDKPVMTNEGNMEESANKEGALKEDAMKGYAMKEDAMKEDAMKEDHDRSNGGGNHEVENEPVPDVVYQLKLRIRAKHDTNKLRAIMQGNGILDMEIPVKAETKPRTIEVHSNNM